MGLYGFQPRFVPFILNRNKTHTIRATRKHPDVPGNTLHLYTGLRTKKAKLIMRVTCIRVENIRISMELYAGKVVLARGIKFPTIFINGDALSRDETEALARRDGFANFADMMEFWKGRLPFEGQIVHWRCP